MASLMEEEQLAPDVGTQFSSLGGLESRQMVMGRLVSAVSRLATCMAASLIAISSARVLEQREPAGARTSTGSLWGNMIAPPPPLVTPSFSEPSAQTQIAGEGSVWR